MPPRLLMVVSSAREMEVADGTHPTGYWAEEVDRPLRRFRDAGVEVVVATPDGQPPRPDPWGLEHYFQYRDEDEDFLLSVFRSFARDVEDVRVTLTHLTELNLIASRRVHAALVERGVAPATARELVEGDARTAWRDRRDFVDVLAADDEVTAHLDAAALRGIADEVRAEAEQESDDVAARLAGDEALQHPLDLRELDDEEVLGFDAVFFPGGHGPMVDLADNPDVGRVLGLLHARERTIGALCHGPAALLSAETDEEAGWLFDGYKMTAFTDEEEDQTRAAEHGMLWYLESSLKNAGAVFDDADAPWTSHVIVDRNLVTAQNPNSSDAAADAILKRLEML